MSQFADYKISCIIDVTYHLLRFVKAFNQTRRIHCLRIVSKVSVRFLFNFNGTLDTLIMFFSRFLKRIHVEQRRLVNELLLGVEHDNLFHDAFHQRRIVIGNRDINAQWFAYLILLTIEHLHDDFIHRISLFIEKRKDSHFLFGLPKAVDTSVTLLHTIGIPRQIVVDNTVETCLEIDTFRKTVGTYKDVTRRFRQLVNLHLAVFICKTAGDDLYGNILVLLVTCQLLGNIVFTIFCCLDILAENNGVVARIEGKLNTLS